MPRHIGPVARDAELADSFLHDQPAVGSLGPPLGIGRPIAEAAAGIIAKHKAWILAGNGAAQPRDHLGASPRRIVGWHSGPLVPQQVFAGHYGQAAVVVANSVPAEHSYRSQDLLGFQVLHVRVREPRSECIPAGKRSGQLQVVGPQRIKPANVEFPTVIEMFPNRLFRMAVRPLQAGGAAQPHVAVGEHAQSLAAKSGNGLLQVGLSHTAQTLAGNPFLYGRRRQEKSQGAQKFTSSAPIPAVR